MNKVKSRIISALLTFAVMLSLMPVIPVSAATGWTIVQNGGKQLTEVIDGEVFHSGNASLRISSTTMAESNVYLMLRQYITIKPNTEYSLSFWSKADNAESVFTCVSWGVRTYLTNFSTNWEWKKTEIVWSSDDDDTRAEPQIILDGLIDAFWVDDLEFYELDDNGNKVGSNLFTNPGFEEDKVTSSTETDTVSTESYEAQTIYSGFKNTDLIPLEDFEKTTSLYGNVPAVYSNNIKIDAEFDDWNDAVSINIPSCKEHIAIVNSSLGDVDATAKLAWAYDKNNIYMMAQVKDDIHHFEKDGSYWKGDCIQFVVSHHGESFGKELGIYHTDNGAAVYCSAMTEEELSQISASSKRIDDITYYEIAIPWAVTSLGKLQEDILICAVVADNDGEGRMGCLQTSAGIVASKNNTDYYALTLMPQNEKSYSIVEGSRRVNSGEENKYDLYYANRGGDADIIYTLPGTSEAITVSVKANSVLHIPFNHTFNDVGLIPLQIAVKDNGRENNAVSRVSISRSMENFEAELIKLQNETIPRLKSLIDKCTAKGIGTAYEDMKYSLAEMYIPYIRDSLAADNRVHAEYELQEILKICKEAETALNSYLNDKEIPLESWEYITSDLEMDGQTVWADMKNTATGEIKRRPYIGVGFGHFEDAQKDLEIFPSLGNNMLQVEWGISGIVKDLSDISEWSTHISLGTNTSEPIVQTWNYDTEVKKDGAASLKITRNDAKASNRYCYKYQKYNVQEGKTYNLRFDAKGTNVNGAWVSIGGWKTSRVTLNGTYDWTEFTQSYTAKAGDTVLELFILADDNIEALNIDNVVLTEEGSDKNLISNGDFEIGYDLPVINGEFRVDTAPIYKLIEILERAEEANVSVVPLTSFHYFPDSIKKRYPDIYWGVGMEHEYGGYALMNLNHPKMREVIEIYLRTLIPLIKDYKSLNSICIHNEPSFCTAIGDFYLPDYHKFLQERYNGDLTVLNKNYGTQYSSFDDVPFPDVSSDEACQTPHFYDWYDFNRGVFTDFSRWYADIIREYTEIPLHMKTLSHTHKSGYYRSRLINGVDNELLSDFLNISGCDAHAYLNQSGNSILAKMRWYDYNTSIANQPVFDTENHVIEDKKLDQDPRHAKHWEADLWECAVHGRSLETAWTWRATHDSNSIYYGMPLMRPDVLAANGKTSLDLNRLSYEIKALQDKTPEIGILYVDSSRAQNEEYLHATYSAWEASVFAGLKAGFVTDRTAAAGELNKYKLLIITQSDKIAKETVNIINEYVNNGGRVLIIGEESLKYNEYGIAYDESVYKNIYNKATVVPIEVDGASVIAPAGEEYRNLVGREMDAVSKRRVQLIDTATGKAVYDTEYLSTEYNDGFLINVNNFSLTWNSKTVELYVDGVKPEKVKELRSNKDVGSTITIEAFQPILLYVE